MSRPRAKITSAGTTCLLALVVCLPFATAGTVSIEAVSDTILVRSKNRPAGNVSPSVAKHGVEDAGEVGAAGWRKMKIKDNKGWAIKMEQLKADGYEAEPDYIVKASLIPNDSAWSSIATAMNKIQAPLAWDLHTGGANAPIVCIIDSGINLAHPDLMPNIHPSKGFNAITNTEGAACNDDNSHGSHCAGTIGGAGNNGAGVAGVTWNVKMLGCKFLSSSGSGSTSGAVQCVKWCRSKGAKITSNSWGGGGFSQALYDEIRLSQTAGHLFIAAAGNENTNIDASPSYPAAYNLDNVISVGAVSPVDDSRASFSNYGRTNVDLFAPGVGIYSSVLGSNYASYSGTSMACPHVSGAAALIWSYQPQLSASAVKALLMNNVDTVAGLSGLCITGGRLNINKALRAAGGNTPSPSPSPSPSPNPNPNPSTTIRLVGGPNTWTGRVEVKMASGTWGTVCDDYWDSTDAKVVCRQLGLPTTYATAYGTAQYGQNTAIPIVMDNVGCTGNELTLQSCAHVDQAHHDCTHVEDAAVSCPSSNSAATVRLVNGGSTTKGRVEVNVNGVWGTVCDDYFGAEEARVICRQLGLPWTTAQAVGFSYFGQNSALPILMDDLACTGTENFIQSCKRAVSHNCFHYEDAGVICSGATTTGLSSMAGGQKDPPLIAQADDFSGGENGKPKFDGNGNGNGGGNSGKPADNNGGGGNVKPGDSNGKPAGGTGNDKAKTVTGGRRML